MLGTIFDGAELEASKKIFVFYRNSLKNLQKLEVRLYICESAPSTLLNSLVFQAMTICSMNLFSRIYLYHYLISVTFSIVKLFSWVEEKYSLRRI